MTFLPKSTSARRNSLGLLARHSRRFRSAPRLFAYMLDAGQPHRGLTLEFRRAFLP